ncbi:tyrosine-type recombinase/integrase [Pontibacillus halophilus]|uniref:tyrosine-type recombinase/integrase n=1 Tax=Pontibacillus halophilus TaxID=516704 RepID=UPI00042A7F13|nr:site-specific integrase [Pontibacillus halophilus]
MPNGYSIYLREEKKRSEITIDEHVRQIQYFLNYIDSKYRYEKVKELYEISVKDIKDYIALKSEKGLKSKTINKILAILKSYFDYLEREGIIGVDPAAKLKYKPLEPVKREFNYERLLEVFDSILDNPHYSLLRKCVFIFAIKGIRINDLHFTKDDVKIYNHSATIVTGQHKQRTIHLIGKEYEVFMEFYNNKLFESSEYVFTSRSSKSDELTPIDKVTVYINLKAISEDHDLEYFSLNDIRLAYCHYLYYKEHVSIKEIASIMGVSSESVTGSLKRIRESITAIET